MPVSTIWLTFEGMLVLFVADGAPFADVGLIKDVPEHAASLLIAEIPRAGSPREIFQLDHDNVKERFQLIVENPDGTRPPKIFTHKNGPTFDRKASTRVDVTDFRWVLNYVSDEMYPGPIEHDVNEFRSFLRMNAGTFSTQEISKNNLVLVRPGGTKDEIGAVAVKIRSEIQLVDDDVATFSDGNGFELPLRAQTAVDYCINLSQIRPANRHNHGMDAENYHRALVVPDDQRIHFQTRSTHSLTPDAACFSPTTPPPGY